jgi:hypothetical protein
VEYNATASFNNVKKNIVNSFIGEGHLLWFMEIAISMEPLKLHLNPDHIHW